MWDRWISVYSMAVWVIFYIDININPKKCQRSYFMRQLDAGAVFINEENEM